MKILFYFGHPSQYLFLRNVISILKDKGNECDLLIKSKDVLEKLLIEHGESYSNILPEGRASGRIGTLTGLLKRDFRLLKYVSGENFDLFVGTDPSLAHIGFLRRIPVITVLEDDIDVIPQLAKLTYPFTSVILVPAECKTGTYENKTVRYEGYMKLAYLHPERFNKEAANIRQPYFLIRSSGLEAYHDKGIGGFNKELVGKVIERLQQKGKAFISSEGQLDDSLREFELKINPAEMQQVLANASLLVSDSQSMTMEAAMLGVPSVRFSDFAGRISVLETLEHKYNLTYGIPTGSPEKLLEKLDELLSMNELSSVFRERRNKMLSEKIDVTAFMVWFIENYPQSAKVMQENPGYEQRFR